MFSARDIRNDPCPRKGAILVLALAAAVILPALAAEPGAVYVFPDQVRTPVTVHLPGSDPLKGEITGYAAYSLSDEPVEKIAIAYVSFMPEGENLERWIRKARANGAQALVLGTDDPAFGEKAAQGCPYVCDNCDFNIYAAAATDYCATRGGVRKVEVISGSIGDVTCEDGSSTRVFCCSDSRCL